MTDRERALRILARISERPMAADVAIDQEPGVEERDFVRTLVLGVLRWQLRIDHAIERLARRELASIDPPVVHLLRLGACQLWFTGIAQYAAVSETVELAGRLAPRAKGFVNAVLRRVSENDLATLDPKGDSVDAIAIRASHPLWLVERWARLFGMERTARIAAADQELSYPDVLVNEQRWSVADALEELTNRGIEHERSTIHPSVIRLRESTVRIADLVKHGRLYAMDEGSAAIASLIPRSCERVLDLAAAPGGKSLVLALGGHRVVSNDISAARVQPLRRGSRAMFGLRARIVIGDGVRPAFRNAFDAVLVDAPCGAPGTLRKNTAARGRVAPERVASLAATQAAMLDAALSLAPGFCLYATCSLEPEENDEVVDRVLASRDAFHRVDLASVAPEALVPWIDDGTLRLTPESGADGFTAIGIVRKSSHANGSEFR